MSEPSLQNSVSLLTQAEHKRPSEAISFLFDHYRTAHREAQEALVLALISDFVTKSTRAGCASALASPASVEA